MAVCLFFLLLFFFRYTGMVIPSSTVGQLMINSWSADIEDMFVKLLNCLFCFLNIYRNNDYMINDKKMINWWLTDGQLLINWWLTNSQNLINWLLTVKKLMINSWSIDNQIIINWLSTVEQLRINIRSTDEQHQVNSRY